MNRLIALKKRREFEEGRICGYIYGGRKRHLFWLGGGSRLIKGGRLEEDGGE